MYTLISKFGLFLTGSYSSLSTSHNPPLGYIIAYTPEQIAELVKDQYHAQAAQRVSTYGSPTHVSHAPMSPLHAPASPKQRPFSVHSQIPPQVIAMNMFVWSYR